MYLLWVLECTARKHADSPSVSCFVLPHGELVPDGSCPVRNGQVTLEIGCVLLLLLVSTFLRICFASFPVPFPSPLPGVGRCVTEILESCVKTSSFPCFLHIWKALSGRLQHCCGEAVARLSLLSYMARSFSLEVFRVLSLSLTL